MSTILFVSHDADLCAVASRVLVRAGWQVTAAAHGGHAALACMRTAFDVLVVDDRMPEISGAAIAERLRKYCPDARVVRMCESDGAAGEGIAVVRPFTADDLIAAVSAAAAYTRRGATIR